MPLHTLHDARHLVWRTSGDAEHPPLVYLPGVHGCWTPLAGAHAMLERTLRLVEVAYPTRVRWSLAEHADAVGDLLDRLGIEAAHLVGESFGSLVGWEFGLSRPRRVRSHLLVGGMCRAPGLGRAGAAHVGLNVVPTLVFMGLVDLYVARRGIAARDVDRHVAPYPAVRSRAGRRATARRMRLIQQSDFRERLGGVRFPVRYLGGGADTVVPVAREVQTLTDRLPPDCGFEARIVAGAPHMIVASHPRLTAVQLSHWVTSIERERAGRGA